MAKPGLFDAELTASGLFETELDQGGQFDAGLIVTAPALVFDDIRQDILDGLDSAQAEGTGWDALRSSIPVSAVVRTSATVVTITLPALGAYDITANETITATVPLVAVVKAVPIVATPTMLVTFLVATVTPRLVLVGQARQRASLW